MLNLPTPKAAKSFIAAILICGAAIRLSAQTTLPPATVTDLSFGSVIQNSVNSQTDLTDISSQAVGLIPGAVGPNGAATYTGLTANNTDVLGNGVTGQVTIGWNTTVTAKLEPLGLGGTLGTQMSGNTTISWKTIAGNDGLVHITVTINVGTNTKNITRTLDVTRPVPVSVLQPLTVNDPNSGATSGSVSGDSFSWLDGLVGDWDSWTGSSDVPDGSVLIGDCEVVNDPDPYDCGGTSSGV